jgi:hypothetical protein
LGGNFQIKNKKIVQLNRKGRGFLTGSFSPLPNEKRIESETKTRIQRRDPKRKDPESKG